MSSLLRTLLFFDDESLTARDHVIRRLGKPRRIEESVYRDPLSNCTWGYPAVFRIGAEWRLIYGASFEADQRGGGSIAAARSSDGIHWTPDERTSAGSLPHHSALHQIHLGKHELFASGFEIPSPVAGLEQFNLLLHCHPAGQLWTSADCLHWRQVEGADWQSPNPDPPTFVHWNPIRQRYVLASRPFPHDRRIALFETTDFLSYSPMERVLQADSLDRPLTQIYGMPIFPYDGYYVGLPWMFDISAEETTNLPHKYLGGKQSTQLAYSLNGWNWQRSLREPFIGNGEPGEPDGGCLQASSMVRLDDGSLRFYASTSRHEHGHCPIDDGYIVAYGLRRDGFVYLESDGGVGRVDTRALYWHGGEVELNAQAPAGWVRVQITDGRGKPLPGYTFADSEVLHADNPAWVPTWKDGRSLSALAGTFIRVEIHLENARLYALRGRYDEGRLHDVIAFENSGMRPEHRL